MYFSSLTNNKTIITYLVVAEIIITFHFQICLSLKSAGQAEQAAGSRGTGWSYLGLQQLFAVQLVPHTVSEHSKAWLIIRNQAKSYIIYGILARTQKNDQLNIIQNKDDNIHMYKKNHG